MDQSTNTQTPQATPAPSSGPTMEELQAKMAELEKQSEGRLRDLQEERRKRQELETRVTPTAPVQPPTQDVNQDELGKVLSPYTKPLQQQIAATQQELEAMRLEKAQHFLSEKMGKSWSTLEADRDFQEKLLGVARRYGITGNVYERTTRAYELMELENLRSREAEKTRQAAAAQASGMPSGTPPAPQASGKEYSKDDFDKLALSDYEKLSESGSFHENAEGKIVYTAR